MRHALANLLCPVLLAALPNCAAAQGTDPDRTLVKRVVVRAPIDAVWKAWTTTQGVQSFFAPGARIEARPGGPFEVYFNPYAKPGLKGADDMVVLSPKGRLRAARAYRASNVPLRPRRRL